MSVQPRIKCETSKKRRKASFPSIRSSTLLRNVGLLNVDESMILSTLSFLLCWLYAPESVEVEAEVLLLI